MGPLGLGYIPHGSRDGDDLTLGVLDWGLVDLDQHCPTILSPELQKVWPLSLARPYGLLGRLQADFVDGIVGGQFRPLDQHLQRFVSKYLL